MSVKKISEILGHSNVGITLGIYGHVTKQMDREAYTRGVFIDPINRIGIIGEVGEEDVEMLPWEPADLDQDGCGDDSKPIIGGECLDSSRVVRVLAIKEGQQARCVQGDHSASTDVPWSCRRIYASLSLLESVPSLTMPMLFGQGRDAVSTASTDSGSSTPCRDRLTVRRGRQPRFRASLTRLSAAHPG